MDIGKLAGAAKRLVDQRGGTEALKRDAQELKDIATGEGSLADKAKAAAEALRDPGARGDDAPPAEGTGRADEHLSRPDAAGRDTEPPAGGAPRP
ncbi:hypothetical protein [Miltoncostaea marina]|uniref:hypothetical protein n=1 Tax=Miltoncostaea marina TaxID=2843215 RepID=UPI001C3CF57C|nr:hypothetical protein [Miltoncostaea marina]